MRESLKQKNIAWGFFICKNGFLEKNEDAVRLEDEADPCGRYRWELPCSSILGVV